MNNEIYQILLIDSSENNYHYIKKLLQQTEASKFNLTWVQNYDQALLTISYCDYDGYLINYQEKNLLNWAKIVEPIPVITLINNEQNIDISLLKNGISDYLKYEQLNPIILEHCLRLVIEHSQTKKKNSELVNQYDLKLRAIQEQKSNQTQDLLNSIFENSQNGILIIDRLGIIHFVNQTGTKLLNKPLHKLINCYFGFPFVNNKTTHIEIINSENKITTLEMSVAQTKWQKQPASVVMLRDISREIEYEKSLYQTKEKYETILKTTSEGFFIIDTSKNIGKILEVNDAYCQMIGYSREELLTMSITEIKITETPATLNQYVENFTQEKSDRFETKHRRKDGQIIDVLITVNHLPELNYFYSFITEITERKQMELALRQSEHRYSNLAEAVPVGLYINDAQGNCVYINHKCAELLDINLTECLGTGWLNRLHPDDQDRMLKHWQECFENKTSWEDEYRFIHSNGRIIWVYAQAVFQFDEQGENTGSIGCLTDITERKKLEQELEKSERIFRDLASNIPGAIFRYLVHPDGSEQIIYMSDGCENILEFTAQEITENLSLLWNIIHPDDVSKMTESVNISAQNLEPWYLEWRITTPSGKEKWLQGMGQPQREKNGNIIWNSLIMDITERKQVEYMIQESEKLYRAVVEDQNELICRFLSDGTITFVNQAYCRYFNRQAEDLIGNNWLNLIPVEYREKSIKLLANLQQLTSANPIITEQWVLINGEKRWQQWTNRAIFAEDGTIKEFQGLGQDITEKRKAEVALKQSEETLKLAQKIANLGNWEYDIKTNQNYWSEEIYNIFGKKPAEFEVTVKSFLDCIHPEDQEFVKQKIQQALINKKAKKIDYRIIVDDKIKYVQEYADVILDEKGEVTRIVGTIQDITELKLKEQALKESEASFRSIFENAAIGIAIVNLNGHCFRVNHKFSEFIGYSEEELMQLNFETIIHPEDISITKQYFQESLRGMRDYLSSDKRFICKDGTIKWGNISVSLVRNIDKKAKHFIIIIDDISLRKEAQIALEQAKQAAEDANLAKSQFLANMSHELRTPLNAILGFTQLMSSSHQLTSQHQEYLQIINRAGEHLLSLINDILDLSKIEAGKVELDQESCDLANLLNSVKQMLEIKAQGKKLALIFEIDHQPTNRIITDSNKLSSVLINIIGNAIKFTNQGRIILRTKTNYLNHNQVNLIFEIEDTGVGIDPEEIDSLFDVFIQSKSGKQSGEGSGLGLAISQRFVNLMGGKITVKSKINHGSIFTFNIICELDKNNQNIPISLPNSVVSIKANQPQKRILIVEDKPINSRFLSDLLSDVGFMVQVATNGKEAISIWQTWQPDLILMDIRMPVMNGHQAIQQIRSLESDNQVTNPVKIIAVTARVLAEEKELILQAGCDDFLGKPVRKAELFAKIAHYLDVSYVYDSPPISETLSPSLITQQLDPDALLFMPESWRKELYLAAIAARSKKISALIDDIPVENVENKGIIDRLTFMVQQLDFETMINLTQISE